MPKTGVATLPLHHGRAPRWLFERMVRLAREISLAIISELGQLEFLKRLSDPYWFQALGCILGFDWHSSGLTTTTCGAIKEALRGIERETGIFIAGGKGKTSRKTPQEIESFAMKYGFNPFPLIYASRLSAKVDNSCIQDGYQLYAHLFIFDHHNNWAVIQQGMNPERRTARRYHWISEGLRSFVEEPHRAICSEKREDQVLNMVARESRDSRRICTILASNHPERTIREIERIKELNLPRRYGITLDDIDPGRLYRILLKTYEHTPKEFEELLSLEGVGPKTIRALSLVGEIIYGCPPSFNDPARFSFAHGGKDGTPFPVDRETYDRTIEIIKRAVEAARVGNRERLEALRRMTNYFGI